MKLFKRFKDFFEQLPPVYRLLLLFEILGFFVIILGFALLFSLS